MKKIISLLICFFVFFSGLSNVWAVSFESSSIFWDTKISQPYCKNPEDCGLQKWIEETKWQIKWVVNGENWQPQNAVEYIQKVVSFVLSFLFALTVLLIIFAWVMILTSAWNDDRVETAKKIIKNSVIWLLVIFLAYPISNFIISIFVNSK